MVKGPCLGDEQDLQEEGDETESGEERFPAPRLPHLPGEQVAHAGRNGFQPYKLRDRKGSDISRAAPDALGSSTAIS